MNRINMPEPICNTHPCRPSAGFGKRLATNYQLISKIAEDEDCVLYEAIERLLGRRVVIKVVRPAAGDRKLAQYLRQARLCASLDHPHCLGVLHAETTRNGICIVMPLVRGIRASQLLRNNGPFALTKATQICRKAAIGLAAAHDAGIIHGQLSPYHLLVGPGDELRVDGFGERNPLAFSRLRRARRQAAKGVGWGTTAARKRIAAACRKDTSDLLKTFITLLGGESTSLAGTRKTVIRCYKNLASIPKHGQPLLLPDWGYSSLQEILDGKIIPGEDTAKELVVLFSRLEQWLVAAPTTLLNSESTIGDRPTSSLVDTPVDWPTKRSDFAIGSDLGKYLIVGVLGQGGSGTVLHAFHKTLRIPVAIKVICSGEPGAHREMRQGLWREAQLLAQVNHPNIVRLWDFVDEPPHTFAVLEYVEGPNLAEVLQVSGKLPLRMLLPHIKQVARGLLAAHAANIVHRDVKPGNILLGKDGHTKLADLGLGVIVRKEFDRCGRECKPSNLGAGTAAYMAPEQASANTATDLRCDIYSLGATFYHALTGRMLFEGRTVRELIYKHAYETPLPTHAIVPHLDPLVWEVISKMISKDPNDRYKNCAELLNALDRLEELALEKT